MLTDSTNRTRQFMVGAGVATFLVASAAGPAAALQFDNVTIHTEGVLVSEDYAGTVPGSATLWAHQIPVLDLT